jgi:hypothetical protein
MVLILIFPSCYKDNIKMKTLNNLKAYLAVILMTVFLESCIGITFWVHKDKDKTTTDSTAVVKTTVNDSTKKVSDTKMK